jgi:hypothetical protein
VERWYPIRAADTPRRARPGFDPGEPLVAASGRRYRGHAAIVTTFVEYTNGVLPGADGVPRRANYGSTASVSGTARIDPPID